MARLTGMKEICNYEGKSETTVLDLVRHFDYPAKKINGHIWESDTKLIEEWRIGQLKSDADDAKKGKKAPKRKLSRHKKTK